MRVAETPRVAARERRWVAIAFVALTALANAAAYADTPCDFVSSAGCSCLGQAADPTATCPPSHAACKIALPLGFPCPDIPPDNPVTTEKIALGRFLFYDTKLSGNQTYACASCHKQDKAFTDGLPQAVGSTGQMHPRGAMSLANVGYAGTLGWANPNLLTLEDQALVPMFGETPVELGLAGKEDELLARLRADTRYQRMFAEAYPGPDDPVSLASITRAIASWERTLLSGNSAYDRYRIDDNAISESAKRGETLFLADEKRECFHCHAGFTLTVSVDAQGKVAERSFHNTGLYNLTCGDFALPTLDLSWCDPPPSPTDCARNDSSQPRGCFCDGSGPQNTGCYPPPNTGAYDITHKDEDMGAFKAPTMRNVELTAPYMHDGTITTLDGVLDHYAAGGRTLTDGPYAGVGHDSPSKGNFVRGFTLTDQERADLIEFLKSLTDQEFVTNPHFANPFQAVQCPGDCNLDGKVDVDELVTGINVSLGASSLALCVDSDPSGDGAVTIDELLRSIGSALNGCQ
jgi:cytochrome c peroxidase